MCALPSRNFLSAVLVDDELAATTRLRQMLEAHPDVVITGTAADGLSAVQMINTQRPDIVFLDIQMPELNGFEVINRLTHQPMIVLVTAYNEYAVAAFEKNSLDYLLKPIAPERLALTIRRAFERSNERTVIFDLIKNLVIEDKVIQPISTIPVKSGHKIHLLPINDVYYLEAKDKYVYLHTYDEEKLLDNTLSYLENRLPLDFIKVHRSFIVNKNKIKEIQKYFKGGFIFILSDVANTRIRSAGSFNDSIKARLLML